MRSYGLKAPTRERPAWKCGNRHCSHPFSRAWHATLAGRIETVLGPRGLGDFERAHPDPDMIPCDDCGLIGRHDPSVEH